MNRRGKNNDSQNSKLKYYNHFEPSQSAESWQNWWWNGHAYWWENSIQITLDCWAGLMFSIESILQNKGKRQVREKFLELVEKNCSTSGQNEVTKIKDDIRNHTQLPAKLV